MTNDHAEKADSNAARVGTEHRVNWTRLEGVVAGGALLTSLVWFLGMPTGMAIGVGFGVVLLFDFLRSLLFEKARTDRVELAARESPHE